MKIFSCQQKKVRFVRVVENGFKKQEQNILMHSLQSQALITSGVFESLSTP